MFGLRKANEERKGRILDVKKARSLLKESGDKLNKCVEEQDLLLKFIQDKKPQGT